VAAAVVAEAAEAAAQHRTAFKRTPSEKPMVTPTRPRRDITAREIELGEIEISYGTRSVR